jgi:hypothetical protein
VSDLHDDLLTPSLGNAEMARAPYSERAVFLTAALGGPVPAIALIATNAYRLRRLRRDADSLVGLFLAVLLLIYWLRESETAAHIAALVAVDARRGTRFFIQGFGLVIAGAGHLLHRREQRNADLMGLPRPNPWLPGILYAVLSLPLLYLYSLLLDKL